MTVDPGPLTTVAIILDAAEVTAGDPLGFVLEAKDAYGNDRVTDGGTVTPSSVDVSIEDDGLMTTVAGDYTVTYELDGISADANWTVLAAAAAAVDLQVEDEDLSAGDDVDYEVVVTDAYGNAVDADVTVGCDSTDVEIEDDELTFLSDGVYTCTATVTGTDIQDTAIITVDTEGPEITVLTPERGAWTIASSVLMTGYVEDAVTEVDTLTINGVAPDEWDGSSFEHTVALDDDGGGLTILETLATDTDLDDEGAGNQSRDVRSVLMADAFEDPSGLLDNGMILRMQDDAGGLGALEAIVHALHRGRHRGGRDRRDLR